ncbi:BamA/TamA family outer membrane protein [Flavobacteriaceae bacterium]|nr:BamA/TamA family outer membrane protein [Flavobacteriaceae bacterium]
MKHRLTKILLFIILSPLFVGCNISKNIEKGKLILKSNEIIVDGNKISKDSLSPLLTQNKNNYFLGFPFSAYLNESSKKNTDSIFNSWVKKTKKRKSKLINIFSKKQINQISKYIIDFNQWKIKNGEKLELIDSTKTKISIENLKSFYKNNGYFNSEIKTKILIDQKNNNYGKVVYNINLGSQYYLDSIKTNIESKVLDSIFKKNKSYSFLKKNNPFNTLDFESERNRLNKLFKNSGVYNFQINSISFELKMDTTAIDLSIPVTINILDNKTKNDLSNYKLEYKLHYIKKINVYTNGVEKFKNNDLKKFISYGGINIYSNGDLRYKRENLAKLILIKKDSLYSDLIRSKTINQLNNFENFQYPSISYNYLNNSNSELEANILLVPKKKFSLGFGIDLKHSNIEDIGLAFQSSLTSRNVFKGGEKLEFTSRGTIGKSANTTISEFGVDIRFKFPRFFSPFKFENLKKKPTTYIGIGTSKQTNIGLDRQSFKFDINYDWNNEKNKKINVGLVNIELVNNKNSVNYFNIYSNSFNTINSIAIKNNANSSYFNSSNKLIIPTGIDSFINEVTSKSFLINNEDYNNVSYINDRRNRLTSNNLIIGSSLSISNNNRKSIYDKNFSQTIFKLELAGTFTDFLANQFNADLDQFGDNKILGLTYSQYIKTEFSYTNNWLINSNSLIAFRGYFGIAVPFGNSNSIPFSKSFFAGGSNDNRAWEVYRLGPGSSGAKSEFNEANMKIAMSIEYRFNLIGKLDGALFTDLGNIWNVFDSTNDPKRTFEGLRDLNELAIGSGFGMRYNLGYFVIRLDMGLKTYNPVLETKDRWLTDFNLKKAVFNIGLNYPF